MSSKRTYHQRRTPNPTRHALDEVARSLEQAYTGSYLTTDQRMRWRGIAALAIDVAIQLVEVNQDQGTPITQESLTAALEATHDR